MGRQRRSGNRLTDALTPVRLLGFPLPVYARSQEHFDELRREFALIAIDGADGAERHLPARLLGLIGELSTRYLDVTSEPDRVRDEAIARGATTVDLVSHLPADASAAAEQLAAMLAEVDEFCRAGQHLLTLAAPSETTKFRRWFFAELTRQLTGHPPTPWPSA